MPAAIPFPAPASAPASWFTLSASADGKKATLDLRGQIGVPEIWNEYGVEAAGTFSDFEKAVKALGEDVREIEMNVYSPGGDVFTALAMHDLLVRHPAKITGRVDGIAASAATVVLMAADTVEIPENAYFMIHNPLVGVYGDYREIETMLGRMKKWTRDMANLYTARLEDSGKGDRASLLESVLTMMDAETYLTGAEALEIGFADRTTARMDLAACAGRHAAGLAMQVHHPDRVPEEIRALIDSPSQASADEAHPVPSASNTIPTMSMPEEISAAEPASTVEMPAETATESVPASQPAHEPQPAAFVAPAAANAEPVDEGAVPSASAPAAELVEQLGAMLDAKISPLTEKINAQQAEIERLSALRAHGVDPAAWGNAPAVGDSIREESADAPVAFEELTPTAKINLGVKAYQEKLRAAKRA